MTDSIIVSGIVLSTMPIGENDKRLVLLTRELGRISAFARGARRPGNLLMAASNPFVFGTFTLIRGKSAYSLLSVSVMHYFLELSHKMPGVYYGFYFLELADYFGRENVDGTETLNLLYLTLKALLNPHLDDRLVRRIWELRLLTINGEYAPGVEKMSESTTYACQFIASAPLQKLYTFEVTPDVLSELSRHADRCLRRVLDRKMKSLEILEMFVPEE